MGGGQARACRHPHQCQTRAVTSSLMPHQGSRRNAVSPVDESDDTFQPISSRETPSRRRSFPSGKVSDRPHTARSRAGFLTGVAAQSAPTVRTSDLGAMRAAVFGGGITASHAGGAGLPSGAPGTKRVKGSFASHKPDVDTLRDVQQLQLGLRMQRELRGTATSRHARKMRKTLRVVSASMTMAERSGDKRAAARESQEIWRELRKSRCCPRLSCASPATRHHAAVQREGATLIERTQNPCEPEDTDTDARREQQRAMSAASARAEARFGCE